MTKVGLNLETAVLRPTTVSRLNISHLPGTLASQDRNKLMYTPIAHPFPQREKIIEKEKILWRLTHPA
jgi:hypothetical protein